MNITLYRIIIPAMVTVLLIVTLFSGCNQESSTANVDISPTLPSAPLNLRADPISQTSVTLHWTDSSANEQGFKIYRDGELIETVDTNVISYVDKSLNPATRYRYIVRAYNQAGESGDSLLTVKTLNPPITVKLDRIGVYDNGESAFRDVDGGEVYVYVVVSDGKTTVEERVPLQEDSYLFLEDNEVVDIGTTIFSTDEVGDYLTIAFWGYESDGGDFEQLVYQAAGAAAGSQIGGGAGGLLEAFDFNLGGLIGQFFGEEDDWLGSYENTWNSNNSWGLGEYSDVSCEEEDGTPGLRLWFTVESSMGSSVSAEPASHYRILVEDSLTIDPLDEAAFKSKYSGNYPSQYPFNEYGVYYSELLALDENDTVAITLKTNNQVCLQEALDECEEGLVMMIFRRVDAYAIRTNAVEIISFDVDNTGGTREATLVFKATESGYYQLGLFNKSGASAFCEYTAFTK